MSQKLAAQDRSALIKLASGLKPGSPERVAILAGLTRTASHMPLYGHDNMNSAYVVEDYPYGFKLRTQARFWLESSPSKGFRFISQTRDPKRGVWNKPKASTYALVAGAMYLDEKGHVKWAYLTEYSDAKEVFVFLTKYPKADTFMLKSWVPQKIKYYFTVLGANAQGRSGWSVNGVPQAMAEGDIDRNREELKFWTDVLKKL